jgi:hypothetical protein
MATLDDITCLLVSQILKAATSSARFCGLLKTWVIGIFSSVLPSERDCITPIVSNALSRVRTSKLFYYRFSPE